MGIGGISVVLGLFNNMNPFDIGIGLVLFFIGFYLFNKWNIIINIQIIKELNTDTIIQFQY